MPDGKTYDILAFARGEDEAAAVAAGLAGLAARGWTDAELARTGEITDEDAVPGDFRDAVAGAKANGCALIVYE